MVVPCSHSSRACRLHHSLASTYEPHGASGDLAGIEDTIAEKMYEHGSARDLFLEFDANDNGLLSAYDMLHGVRDVSTHSVATVSDSLPTDSYI